VDADAAGDVDPRAPVVDAGDTGPVDASTTSTCGRGTSRPSCQVFVTAARTEVDFGGLAGDVQVLHEVRA